MRIDSHQHFWRYNETAYPWIPKDTPLHRDWLPDDLAPLLQNAQLDGCVAVQARQTVEETRWLLELAAHSPIIKGVVGWVDLRSPRVEEHLEEFTANHRFVGVRHVLQDEKDPRFMLEPDFTRGIGFLKRLNLTYDILIYPKQLAAAVQLTRRFPEHKFVLDHMAKPQIRSCAFSPWDEQIRQLARHQNVYCKVSGLITEADHQRWKPEDLHPYLDLVFEVFGTGRLMFGSDWPVCLQAGQYEQVMAILTEYTRGLDAVDRDAFFGGNAARFYGLRP